MGCNNSIQSGIIVSFYRVLYDVLNRRNFKIPFPPHEVGHVENVRYLRVIPTPTVATVSYPFSLKSGLLTRWL